ncbi:MAG: hypothetical protein PUA76_03580 [Bacteroidales bacterium]|nr:hypothetical protein [Bacteroidales bacterium]
MKKIAYLAIAALAALVPAKAFAADDAAATTGTTMQFARTVRTTDGLPKANLKVKVKVVLHSGAADGPQVFGEVHETTTSPAGVAYLTIGSQSETPLESLDWAGTTYYMETAVDLGNGYEDSSIQQVMSVPRAIYAVKASSVVLTSPSGKKFSVNISDAGEIKATAL